MENAIKMPLYKSHKKVSALKIAGIGPSFEDGSATLYPADEGHMPFDVPAEYMARHKPCVGGYFVRYDDGYTSYSPAEAFESGYTAIKEEDAKLAAALDLRFDSDTGDNLTFRDYFRELLKTLWSEGECFSGKRPFGNSGWEYDLYAPLVSAGLVTGKLDKDGCIDDVDYEQANALITQMIESSFKGA